MANRNIKQSNFARGALRGLPGPYYNLKPSNPLVFKLKSSMHRTDQNINLPCWGPSTTRGQQTGGGTAQAVTAWPMQLARILRSMGIQAGANNIFADGGSWGLSNAAIANFLSGDARVTVSGGTNFGALKTIGGNAFQFPTVASALNFTPQDSVTRFDIFSLDGTVGRNYSWAIDGGSATTINSSTTSQVLKTTTSAVALGAHTLNTAWVAGGVTMIGFNAYDDTAGRREISLLNWGISGAVSSQLIDDTGGVAGRLAMLSTIGAPAAFMDDWQINDWRSTGPITVAQSQANMTTGAQACISRGVLPILIVPPYDGSVAGSSAAQEAYAAMTYDVADFVDCPVIDCRVSEVSYAAALAAGVLSDSVHKTTLGYSMKAATIAEFIRAVRAL
ncbi:hypothetical protein EQW76_00955 [Rhizobium sp. rho-13.1]|uniref:hypothetical protein n=1 Tax=Rhizobium sp. rho-13.1 TaxID=2506431 RepID=UPI00115C85F6|nr:hypothetical protein [Rhizobium sp. rho-13.1]TQX91335.1 hypothetical protein EQW76_00955 [Rhizobium sp. rho-13.1]